MQLSLKQKINLAIIITHTFFVIVFIGFALPYKEKHFESMIQKVNTLLDALADSKSDILAQYISKNETTRLTAELHGMLDIEGIVSVVLFDASGRLIGEKNRFSRQGIVQDTTVLSIGRRTATTIVNGRTILVFSREIQKSGKVFGFIRIVYSFEGIKHDIQHTFWIFGGLILLCLLFILIILNTVITKTFIRPITYLRDVMQHVREGAIGEQVRIRSDDEIGELAKTFNLMSNNLADSYRRLKTRNRELKNVDQLKTEFLANTSHELRTPLNGIIGIADALMEGIAGEPAPKVKTHLGLISVSAKRLSHLVNDLLDFSMIQKQKLILRRKSVVLQQIVDAVFEMSILLANKKSIRLISDIPEDIPPVYADENRLIQILYNLVHNAVKFTNQGDVRIRATLGDDQMVEISVIDTGIGIHEDFHEKIFSSFEQVDGSTARRYGGAGLGLSITRSLLEAHGSNIQVYSEPEKGARFVFHLPVFRESLHEQNLPLFQPDSSEYPEIGGFELQTGYIETKKTTAPPQIDRSEKTDFIFSNILVVDDEIVNLKLVSEYLEFQGYRVKTAESGAQALALIETLGDAFDMVLLDIMMPQTTGLAVLHRIREKYNPFKLPVVIITAMTQPEDVIKGFRLGANDYIKKPFHPNELYARIEVHLNLKNTYHHLEKQVLERNRELEEAKNAALKTLNELDATRKQLAESAHRSGMAEIAVSVLHNIGNVITPINVWVEDIEEAITEKEIRSLEKVRNLLAASEPSSEENPRSDRRNHQLLDYLDTTLEILKSRNSIFESHLDNIRKGLGHVTEIIAIQQKYAGIKGWETVEDINQLLKDAFEIQSKALTRRGIETVIDLSPVPRLRIDKSKMIQIFVNILKNAYESLDMAHPINEKRIEIATSTMTGPANDPWVRIVIRDTGVGISNDQKHQIFQFNYSTKKRKSGFGLHDCANYIKARNGMIRLESQGPNRGARMVIDLPVSWEEPSDNHSSDSASPDNSDSSTGVNSKTNVK